MFRSFLAGVLVSSIGAVAYAQVLFEPADGLTGWKERSAVGKTHFEVLPDAIRAQTSSAASGIVKKIDLDTKQSPIVSWQWKVDELQESANLAIKGKDDVAASVAFMFGRPSVLFPPPTLAYVWTNDSAEVGKVYIGPRTSSVRYLVLRAGDDPLETWMTEERDLSADFEKAFGKPPPRNAQRICFFTDADQTKEQVVAYYGRVSAEP